MTTTLLIDTDPGVDDALAILMALADDAVDIVGLTVTAGNVGLQHTVGNALKLLEVAGVDVPVFAGAAAPLVFDPPRSAGFVHGEDGFGDTGYLPAVRRASDEHAASAIVRLSRECAGELVLVALGPLTNVALALSLDPTLPQRVKRLIVMGGAVTGRGNTSVPAEFNIGFDPEAAQLVFSRWPRFELVDWEATLAHGFAHDEFEQWLACGDARAAFYAAVSGHTRQWARARHAQLWHSADALAMAYALEPEGAQECAVRHVAVETTGTLTRGATIVDWEQRGGRPPNAIIVRRYESARFVRRIRGALGAG